MADARSETTEAARRWICRKAAEQTIAIMRLLGINFRERAEAEVKREEEDAARHAASATMLSGDH